MINILPRDVKDNYGYARRNLILRRWIFAILIAFIGLLAISTYGMLALQQSTRHYEEEIATTQQIFKDEKYAETQKTVEDMSSNFKLVVKVLGQEILFSELLKQIAKAIPANANLTGLNINQTQGGIDISAVATNYNTASQVQVNLADPSNKIFSRADIVSINCNSDNAASSQYPCSVNVRALFSANNPFLFINSKKATP